MINYLLVMGELPGEEGVLVEDMWEIVDYLLHFVCH
jgi:hypothetical protein